MNGFDYLAGRPAAHLRFEVPAALNAPALTFAAITLFFAGAAAILHGRVNAALHVESAYERRYMLGRIAARGARAYYERVKRLAALDTELQAAALSGQHEARIVFGLADALPPRVALNSLSLQGAGLAMEARGADFSDIAQTIQRLGALPATGLPHLLDATADSQANHRAAVTFSLQAGPQP